MKRVQIVLLGLLLFMGVNATAQRRQNPAPELRQRMSELQLTAEQKRKIANLIRRQRIQNLMNRQELNQILTEKQKALLTDWRKKRFGSTSDSLLIRP